MIVHTIKVIQDAFKTSAIDISIVQRKRTIEISAQSKNKIAVFKTIILPKLIVIDEEFMEGIGLYVGDGKLASKTLRHTEYTTIDEDIARFILNFFLKRLKVRKEDITFSIRYQQGKEDQLRKKWSRILDISMKRFYTYRKRRKMEDSITMQINSTLFTKIFRQLISYILPKILNKPALRKAFLRGEFAADGKLSVCKATSTRYISEITFCYNYKTEGWLKDYIVRCLKLEGIDQINLNSPGDIRVTNWRNYLKFWQMELLDRCKRKKKKFVEVVRQAKIYLKLNPCFLEELLIFVRLPPNKIRERLKLHRSNFIKVRRGEQLLTLEQVSELISLANLNWSRVWPHIKCLRVGRNTYLKATRSFILFLKKEKRL
jgi:hypothetical protein